MVKTNLVIMAIALAGAQLSPMRLVEGITRAVVHLDLLVGMNINAHTVINLDTRPAFVERRKKVKNQKVKAQSNKATITIALNDFLLFYHYCLC